MGGMHSAAKAVKSSSTGNFGRKLILLAVGAILIAGFVVKAMG